MTISLEWLSGTKPEGKGRAASCRLPLRSWSPGRRSGRVATAPDPPPRPSSIVALRDGRGNDLAGRDQTADRLASRAALLLSREDPLPKGPMVLFNLIDHIKRRQREGVPDGYRDAADARATRNN